MKKPFFDSNDNSDDISLDKTNVESNENYLHYKVAEGYLARSVAGETVIVPVGERSQDLNGYATFTETGQFLWSLLSTGERTIADLIYELAIECKVSPEDIQNDVNIFVKKMLENGFIVKCTK